MSPKSADEIRELDRRHNQGSTCQPRRVATGAAASDALDAFRHPFVYE